MFLEKVIQVPFEQIRETFNDGILKYGKYETIRSENRKRTGKNFAQDGVLFYRELSVRESDYLQYGAMGSTLDLKVKTPMPPSLKNINKDSMIIKIGDIDYNIINVDRDKNYLFFYLHKVGE